ncbi:unnamed protein product [Urochloa humidicola]
MRRSQWRVKIGKLFGSQYPCTSGRGKCGSRKNNDHWSQDEMIELVDGVSKTGIGIWSRLKELLPNVNSYGYSSQGQMEELGDQGRS